MALARKRGPSAIKEAVGLREFPGRQRRVHVNMPASVQVTADRALKVRIVDLSASGFRLVSEEPLVPRQLVEVQFCKDAGQAEIRWVNGLEAGGVFIDRPPITY